MRKLATIRLVSEVLPIEGADNIELVRIDGWQVVVKKNEFLVGEPCIFCEVDSWVPETVAPFLFKGREFNGIKGERLRTIKLRGQLSQGLVLPIATVINLPEPLTTGADVTDFLGIQKWERPLPAQLVGQAKGFFPEFLRKTDQERCQNLVSEISEAYSSKTPFEVTVKLDGSSLTAYYKDGIVGVCSRNLELKLNDENSGNTFIRTATERGLLKALSAIGRNLAVQGELMGEGVQGNRENLKQHNIYIFDIFDIDNQCYLRPHERMHVFNDLKDCGYSGEHCPVIGISGLPFGDVSKLLEFAEGPSIYHPVREGLVFKRLDGVFSFKAISNKYLLKEKD